MKFNVAVLSIMLASIALQANAGRYSIYPETCPLGMGPEGNVIIGSGEFSLTETSFKRQSSLRDIGQGWTEGEYSTMSEGEPGEIETVQIRITDERVELRFAQGQEFSAARCP